MTRLTCDLARAASALRKLVVSAEAGVVVSGG